MTAISAAAAGVVGLVTIQLGRKSRKPGAGIQPTGVFVQPTQYDPKQAAGTGAAQEPTVPSINQPGTVVMTSRAQWGARKPDVTPQGRGEHGPYNAVTNPDGWLIYDQPLEQVLHTIIIHHSALPLSDGPVEIQNLHMDEKDFADVGYQYLINERGELFEGRAMNVRGAHTYGYNYGSVGICLIGNFEELQPTEVQLAKLDALLNVLVSSYPRIQRLAGHKDCNPGVTLCPGANLHALLPGIAQRFGLLYGV